VEAGVEESLEQIIERSAPRVFPLAGVVSKALEGAVFPLSRAQLVLIARENDASRTTLSLLHTLPDRQFESLDQIEEQVANGTAQAS
jgi:hypothetical protein